MTIKVSTGLRNSMLTNKGFREALQGGRIVIYPAPRASHPDQSIAVPALGYITNNGVGWLPSPNNVAGGLVLASVPATVNLAIQGTWTLKGIATGVAAWFRFVGPDTDSGGLSTTLPRLDGDCGSELILSNYNITSSYEKDLDAFEIAFSTN